MHSAISVVVGTYGSGKWLKIAERAIASIEAQTFKPLDYHHVHGRTLAEARNEGANRAAGDLIIFLDADDELDEQYVEAMWCAQDSAQFRSDYRTFLFQPATLGIVNGVPDKEPTMIPARDIKTGNFMVIGTMVSKKLFTGVGGFRELDAWEDWDLWWRCMNAGAGSIQVSEAIYRVHVNPDGRNNLTREAAIQMFHQITSTNLKGRP